jgi:hypothetical protein
MRLVKVKAPSGLGNEIMSTAFSVGIESVSFHQVEKHTTKGKTETQDVVDIETSTPNANRFIDRLLAADYFDRELFSFNVREPRSVLTSTDMSSLTVPLEVPPSDLFEELWQFTHITYSLVGRIFIASCLIAFGLIQHQILLIIAGLLFLPLLPMLTAVGFGAITRNWQLGLHGIAAFGVSISILIIGGAAVGALSSPPLRYDEFPSITISLLLTAGVGIAAGLAAIDDVGRRELIGLAAAAQIGITPVWIGVYLVFGLPSGESELYTRIVALLLNILMLLLGSVIVYWISGVAASSLRRIESRRAKSAVPREVAL